MHWKEARMRGGDPDDVLHWHGLSRENIPIPIEWLVGTMGVATDIQAGAGACRIVYTTYPTILTQPWGDLPRQRFAFAHGLGQMLDRPGFSFPLSVASFAEQSPLVHRANVWACNLLCPLWLIHPISKGPSRKDLAEHFQVPRHVIDRQFHEMYRS